MITYVPASDAVKNDYVRFKQHLMAYTGKLMNFDKYNTDAVTMCETHKMDDEIKSNIINTVILNYSTPIQLQRELGRNHLPTDEQLDNIGWFDPSILDTWPYFTYAALRYIVRTNNSSNQITETRISKFRWDDQCLSLVCTLLLDIKLIKRILDVSGLSLTISTLVAAYSAHDVPLIEFHNMPITPECIIAASNKNDNNENKKFVLNLIDQQPLTIDTLLLMIRVKQCTKFKNILKHVTPTQECVKLACTHHRIDLIPMLLNYRLFVDAECFELMFFTGIKADSEQIANTIEHFLLAGYQLTYEDVIRLTRRRYYVRDIQRFNFKFDEELITTCITNTYFPYDLPYTIESLRLACRISDISLISKIIDYGIIPDTQCLKNAMLQMIWNEPFDSNIIALLLPHVTPDAELTYQLIQHGYLKASTTKY